jgi:hypothetical protein
MRLPIHDLLSSSFEMIFQTFQPFKTILRRSILFSLYNYEQQQEKGKSPKENLVRTMALKVTSRHGRKGRYKEEPERYPFSDLLHRPRLQTRL